MDARDDRKTLAGMLQRTVATTRDNSGKDCPGPDLLAAYYERTLSPAEQQHWEAHFSSCARCQTQLAALARSEPQPQLQPLWSWRWHWAVKWLPAAAVALAAIAIWIALRPNNPLRWFEKKPLEVATTAPVSPNQQQELREATRAESPVPPAPESTSKATPGSPTVEKQQAGAPKPQGAQAESAATARTKRMGQGAMARMAPPAVAQKKALPSAVAGNVAPAGQAVASAENKAVQDQASAAMSTEVTAMARAPSPSPSAPSARPESSEGKMHSKYAAGAAGSAFRAEHLQVLEARSAEVLIASPDPAVQWRIGRIGNIERSTDGGKTWQGQFAAGWPGLLAGSSPSAKVCWVVGRAGTILRTRDGEKWERVAPPVFIDLTGIKAENEKSATITTADGRTFSTQDGGKTWQFVPQDH